MLTCRYQVSSIDAPSLDIEDPQASNASGNIGASLNNTVRNWAIRISYRCEIWGFPILGNHANLSLLVAGSYFHANPIVLRWNFTLASSSATLPSIRGNEIS